MRSNNIAMTANIRLLKLYREPFRKTFHVNLGEFWINNLLGFDIIKFDEYLDTPDGVSMSEHIEQVYGKAAHAIVSDLIGV